MSVVTLALWYETPTLPFHTTLLTIIQNTVAADPQGKGYASGGEDGYVRVHQFDKGYFDFTYEVERQARQNL